MLGFSGLAQVALADIPLDPAVVPPPPPPPPPPIPVQVKTKKANMFDITGDGSPPEVSVVFTWDDDTSE